MQQLKQLLRSLSQHRAKRPVQVKAAAAVGVGLTTGAFVYSQGANPNAIMSNVPNSSSPDTANPFIHCPLEEGDNTFSFIDAGGIYKSLLQWLKSNSSDRFPSETSVDMIDYMSSAAFFTNYNLREAPILCTQ
jgi:hypothetical protein